MKNQNDLIVSIVAFILMAIIIGVAWGTKKDPVQPTPPQAVNLAQPQLPTAVVPVMSNSLPNGGSNSSGGGPGAGPVGPAVGGGGGAMAPQLPAAGGGAAPGNRSGKFRLSGAG